MFSVKPSFLFALRMIPYHHQKGNSECSESTVERNTVTNKSRTMKRASTSVTVLVIDALKSISFSPVNGHGGSLLEVVNEVHF